MLLIVNILFVFVKAGCMTGSDHERAFKGFSGEEILEEFREAGEVIIPKYPQTQEEAFERLQVKPRRQEGARYWKA